MYLLKESLYGKTKSKFILIKDSACMSGMKLFKAVAQLYFKEDVNLHFIYYESLCQDIHKIYDSENISHMDAVSDPFGWNGNEEAATNLRLLDELKKEVSTFKGVVCIDSLSPLLFQNNANDVYCMLHKLLKDNDHLQLLALLHDDVHESYVTEIMEKLASTVVFVLNEDKLLSTVHNPSGKVLVKLMEYKISDKFEFSILQDTSCKVKSAPTKKPDPTANLTFNLKLKDNEKEARSQLVLPYMQMQNNDAIKVDDDMYDEEDPDDDLDI